MQTVKKKILVIDDDQGILEAMRAILEAANYQVETISYLGNWQIFSQKQLPDLIILDLLLSGIDGKAVAKRLKSEQRTQSIPIILLSAYPAAQKAALEAGVDEFLAKPFEMEDLLSKISKHL